MRTLTLFLLLLALGCGKKKPPAPPATAEETSPDSSAERATWLARLKPTPRPDDVRTAADELAILADTDPDVFPALVELLKDKTTAGAGRTRATQVNSTREAAAAALVRCGPKGEAALKEKGFALLKEGLADPSAAIREHTAYTLGTLGPTAKPLAADVQKLCTDPDANVRGAAFDALRWIGVSDALGMANLLVHENAEVRRLAAELFPSVTEVPADAVAPLTKSLADETDIVRGAAATGLRLVGPKAASAVDAIVAAIKKSYPAEADVNTRVSDADDACWRALVAIGEPAVGPTADLMKHTNAIVRAFAARALGEIGPPAKSAAPALKAALTDRFAEVALEAACALCRVGESQADAVNLVKEAMEKGTQSVPGLAIEAIPRMGEPGKPLVPVALGKLTDANPLTRYAAASLVRSLDPEDAKKAVPDVAKLAADEFPEVRRRAAASLEALGINAAPAAEALGKALLDEKDDIVRDAFVDALAAMGTGAKAAIPGLLPLIGDANAPLAVRLKVMAVVALADPASPEVAAALVKAARGGDKFLRRPAAFALAKLNPLPTDAAATLVGMAKTDPDYLARGVAVKALALAGPRAKAVRADVASIAAGDNPAFALWANVALAAIDGDVTKAAPTIRAGLTARDISVRIAAAEALPLVGPTAADVPPLLTLIRERQEAAREAAAVALGRVGPAAKDAVPRLVELLEDRNGETRAAAAEALGRIGPPAATVAIPRLREKLTDREAASAARKALEKLGAKDEGPKR